MLLKASRIYALLKYDKLLYEARVILIEMCAGLPSLRVLYILVFYKASSTIILNGFGDLIIKLKIFQAQLKGLLRTPSR